MDVDAEWELLSFALFQPARFEVSLFKPVNIICTQYIWYNIFMSTYMKVSTKIDVGLEQDEFALQLDEIFGNAFLMELQQK